MAVKEVDNSTKALIASSALLAISRSQRDPSLAEGNRGLKEMADFFAKVEYGPEILEFLEVSPLPPNLYLVRERAKMLQETTTAILEDTPYEQEDLQSLEDYLRRYHNYYQQLIQGGITGTRRCWG